MSRLASQSAEQRRAGEPGVPQQPLLNTELEFYDGYPWCLNPYPTARETVVFLGQELDRIGKVREGWQLGEVLTNVFLLSCALLNTVDEYLRGKSFQLPKKAPVVPFFRLFRWLMAKADGLRRWRRRARARRWRAGWQAGLDAFLPLLMAEKPPDPAAVADSANTLTELLRSPLPADLLGERIYFPSAFRKHDLTHFDVLALGRKLVARFSDREQPILLLGLRTAGSYFAPLLRTFLVAEGYRTTEVVTVRPDKGPGAAEQAQLTRCARAGYLAVIVDDSPRTGDTIVQGARIARKAGFPSERVAALVPVHPAMRDWRNHAESLALADMVVLTLEAEEWHKVQLLESAAADRLREYFRDDRVSITPAEQFNARVQAPSEEARRVRLKRVYEVRQQIPEGEEETRYVLAKSVGWGWLGYHAFLAGQRLAGLVPPVLGLRDGILYSEWLPQPLQRDPVEDNREQWVAAAASYVAARARSLKLGNNPFPSLALHQHHESFRLLDRVLSRAYGGLLASNLRRPRLRQRLSHLPCPFPTLIDGKMEPAEWVAGPHGLLKTDFEHHGMGKNELNVIDPAYDLAEAILRLELSPQEEEELLRRYIEESGDTGVEQRLFLNKLLAGVWTTASALKYLFRRPPLPQRQQEFSRQFLTAWHFLTVQAARFCGNLCRPPAAPSWRSPLVVLDIDGVLDRRLFGFPHTTAAGIEALALLHTHDFTIAVNTARSAEEVKEYCRAYGLAGGVAEHGAYIWDAVNGRGRVLLSPETLGQLEEARKALARLPGVFLDERHQFSIRACTFEDRPAAGRSLLHYILGSAVDSPYDGRYPVPLPTLAVRHVLEALGLDRLCIHQTGIDTTIVAAEVDKGTSLSALLEWVGLPASETTAVGDSEHDLPMFRVAGRSFAPAQIGCARLARGVGCKIVRHRFQRGLLDIARSLVHANGGRCPRLKPEAPARGSPRWRFGLQSKSAGCKPAATGGELFLDLLRAADRSRLANLFRALLDPRAYRAFVR